MAKVRPMSMVARIAAISRGNRTAIHSIKSMAARAMAAIRNTP